jgi:uncharacterized Zn finger protein
MAGEKVYARGEAYAANGHICLLSAGADGILAIAHGTLDYTVWIGGHGQAIEGRCTCPAYEDFGFCKHLVATALVANDAWADGDRPDDAIALIAKRVAMLEKTQLARLVVELAKSDWRVLRSLHFELGFGWDFDLD